MTEETIWLNPDRLGYKDRGIMKWQGLILSHQRDAIKKLEQEYADLEVKEKEEMKPEEISEVLYNAWASKLPVVIQANVIRNGNYYPDVHCLVQGFSENEIILYVRKKNDEEVVKRITIDMIRNVQTYDVLKWHNKIK